MSEKTLRLLRGGLAFVMAVCMIFSTPVTALAAVSSTPCVDEAEAIAVVDEAIKYNDLGRTVIRLILSNVIDTDSDTIRNNFKGSATNSLIAGLAVDLIKEKIVEKVENGSLRLEDYGLENNDETHTLLAEEVYKVACIYYDEIRGEGKEDTPETRAVADEKCMREILRFALVTINGYSESKALEYADFYYELNEINAAQGKDAAIARAKEELGGAHNYGEPVWSWAEDYTSASAAFTCTVCDYSQTVVTEDISKTVTEASCEADGQVVYTATAVLDSYTKTSQMTVKVGATGHSYNDVVTAPTCTEKGYTTHTCACGDSYVDSYVDAAGHTEEITAKKAATCTEDGLTEGKKCSVCDAVIVAQEIVPALGHTEEVVAGKPATCTVDGLTDGKKCSACEAILEPQEVIPAAHKEEIVPGKAATCTEDGLTEGKKCVVCGAVTVAQEVVPAGHTEEILAEKAATCTEDGLTEGKQCSVCGTILEPQEVITAQGHTWDNGTVTKEPTEETTGVKTYTCTVCKETREEVLPVLEHSHRYTDVVTAPTCTEQGYTTHTCRCGDSYVDTYVDALGHTEKIVAAKEATCTESGLTEGKKCAVCDTVIVAQETVPALGHTEEIVVAKEATCTESGLTEGKKCSVCDVVILAQETVPALGHTEEIVAAKEATCTESGLTEGKKCSVCETVTVAQQEIPALGHSWDEGTVSEEDGVVVYKCTVCGETMEEQLPEKDTVTRVFGDDRYATAFAVADAMKEVMGVEKFASVVVVYSENFPDALAGSYLAAVADAPILLTKDKASRLEPVKTYINENLVSGGKVYILGSEGVVPVSLENDLNNAGFDVDRLAGDDRYETNLAVLKVAMELDADKTKPILVATGRDFADSLSVSAAGLPVLLVRGDKTLSENQEAFLAANADRDRIVIGSEGVVSAKMYDAVGASKRVAGTDRYLTSVAVANEFIKEPNAVVLAYASTFPDGLCGGPLAYQMGVPLILTKVKHEDIAAEYVAQSGISSGYVLGSNALVTDDVVRTIFDLGADTAIGAK